VLEYLQAYLPDHPACYWRDKAGHEVHFVLVRPRGQIEAIECKWNPRDFDSTALETLRKRYPSGKNYVVTPHDRPAYVRRLGGLEVTVCNPEGLGWDTIDHLAKRG
jgi:hypothetical protein